MFRGWFPRACRAFATGLGLAVPGSKFMPHWFAVASLLLRSNFRYRAVSCLRVVHCNCWRAVIYGRSGAGSQLICGGSQLRRGWRLLSWFVAVLDSVLLTVLLVACWFELSSQPVWCWFVAGPRWVHGWFGAGSRLVSRLACSWPPADLQRCSANVSLQVPRWFAVWQLPVAHWFATGLRLVSLSKLLDHGSPPAGLQQFSMTLRCELLLVLTVGFQWIPAGLSLVLAVPGWFSAGSRRGSFPTVTDWFAVRLCSASALWMVSLSV